MPVRIRRQKFQRGAQMEPRARDFAVRQLVICDRRAQQPQVKVPIVRVVLEQVHRVFHGLVRFEKFAAIEQLDAERELRVNFIHRGTSASPAQGSSSLSDWSAVLMLRVCLRVSSCATKMPRMPSLTSPSGKGSDCNM